MPENTERIRGIVVSATAGNTFRSNHSGRRGHCFCASVSIKAHKHRNVGMFASLTKALINKAQKLDHIEPPCALDHTF
jgi:hypothetical protein